MAWRRTPVSDSSEQSVESGGLTPAQRLEPPNSRLINAGIVTIHDMETLRACVAYENANQQRVRILRVSNVGHRKSAPKRDKPALNRRFPAPQVASWLGYWGFPGEDYSRTNDEDNATNSERKQRGHIVRENTTSKLKRNDG